MEDSLYRSTVPYILPSVIKPFRAKNVHDLLKRGNHCKTVRDILGFHSKKFQASLAYFFCFVKSRRIALYAFLLYIYFL